MVATASNSHHTRNNISPSAPGPGQHGALHVVNNNVNSSVSPAVDDYAKHNQSEQNNYQRFSHLLSIMPAGVLVIDKTGVVSLANKQATALLGEPLVGIAWRDIISRAFTPKADDGHEVSMRNGKRVKIDISPLTQEKGQLIVVTDLTETRQLQSRMGHMQRLSSLGKMVASLAHQVRTPLSSALLYAENLKSMPLQNETASRFSEKLTLRLKELESQVNDMLLFAKSSDKQIVAQLTVDSIVQHAIGQIDAQLEQAGVQFKLYNPHPDTVILGNLTALSGALSNLIANAMQALVQSQQHTPCIRLTIETLTHNDQAHCVFTVQDNGAGIAEQHLKRIFEPFYTSKSQGTGLGLAVVNTVAKSHKGFAKCGNNAEQGAYFSLYLPVSNPQNQQAPTSVNQQSSGVYNEQN
ncbi:MAG: ATP-binding protein [Glaciecola sp.]